jgi:hypothetical protein
VQRAICASALHDKVALEDGGAPFDIENFEGVCASCHSVEKPLCAAEAKTMF